MEIPADNTELGVLKSIWAAAYAKALTHFAPNDAEVVADSALERYHRKMSSLLLGQNLGSYDEDCDYAAIRAHNMDIEEERKRYSEDNR